MIKLKIKNPKNIFKRIFLPANLTLFSFGFLVIIFFSFEYSLWISFSLGIIWIAFLISKQKNYGIKPLIFLFVISLLSFYIQQFWFSTPIPQTIKNQKFTITSISNNYVILKYRHWKILWWTNDRSLILNQKITIISSTIEKIKSPDNSYNFNFAKFLNTKYVYYQFDKPEWLISQQNRSLRFYFFEWLNRSNLHPLVKALVWQQPVLSELKNNFSRLNWGYLWVFNGLAFSFIGKIFGYFHKWNNFSLNKWLRMLIYGPIWLFYWYLLGFNLIIFRLLVRFGFQLSGFRSSAKQKRVLTLIILSWWEPTYLLRMTSWFLIVLYLAWPSNNRYPWYKKLFISWALIIPLQVMLNYRLNLFGPILLILIGPLFAIIHCTLFLLWWCPWMDVIWNFLVNTLTDLSSLMLKISFFWNFGHVPLFFYLSYFLLFNFQFLQRKFRWSMYSLIFNGLVILSWNKLVFANESIFMLNVGNGNSFVYVNKFKNLVLVFDCGSGPGYLKSNLADFLKWHGINHVDYLFISHAHEDHYNGLESIKNVARIKQIITNQTKDLIWNFKGLTIIGWKLEGMKDINDSSLVLLLKTSNASLLFMGDLTKVGEEKLIKTTDFSQIIKQIKIDWMQLGHHGSKNATSFELLKLVNPSYVFISSGIKNDHQFPDYETLDKLQKLGIKFWSTSNHLNWKFNLISQKITSFH